MAKTIFLLENAELEDIQSQLKLFDDVKIFSMTIHAHRILTTKKISHEYGDKYLTTSDKTKINELAISSTTNWQKNTPQEYFKINNIDLTKFFEFELLPYFLSLYRLAFSIITLIEQEKPKKVICESILNNFILTLCERYNIQCITHQSKQQLTLQYDRINIKFNFWKIPISFTISRTFFNKIKKILKTLTKICLAAKYTPNRDCILLLDFDPIAYEYLYSELSKLNKNILILNQRRPAIWNLQSFRIIQKSKVNVIHLDDLTKYVRSEIDNHAHTVIKQLETILENEKSFTEFYNLNSISLWPDIKNSFINICKQRMNESVVRLCSLQYLFKKYDISAVLEWAELSQEEKEVLAISKQNNIPVVQLQHAMYPTSEIWKPFGRFLLLFNYLSESDIQAVWGKSTENHARSLGFNKNLIITGSPRHDKFFLKQNKPKINKHKKILLATTTISDYDTNYSTIDYYVKYDSFVKEVCDSIKSIKDIELIVKPHPASDFLNNMLDLIHEIDPQIKISHTQNLIDLISDCDLVITFNNSTIALESVILGVPAITLQVEEWATDIAIVNEGAILAITEQSEIRDGILKVLNDANFRSKMLENARKFVDNYMYYQGIASSQVGKLLSNIKTNELLK